MNILVIKTSSMGDIIHTLPALTDVEQRFPHAKVDWVVEEDFAEIPTWHANVDRVIPIALRRWKKTIWRSWRQGEYSRFIKQLRQFHYDYIIDAQGLTKSALVARFARGKRFGLSSRSARDPCAFLHYHQHYHISWQQHAVERIRTLFAQILGYTIPSTAPDYGLNLKNCADIPRQEPYLVFLPGTTWQSKQWPETYWRQLIAIAVQAGFYVYVNSGNAAEWAYAQRITTGINAAIAMSRHKLGELAMLIARATGIVTVDTGLGHLSAALAKPTVSIYGATAASMTGLYGHHQTHLQADFECSPCLQKRCIKQPSMIYPPCYTDLNPEYVWTRLQQQVQQVT